MDVIFDAVGGETLRRSWGLLNPGGRLVTIAANSEAATDPRVKDAFFIVEPDGARLAEIAKLIDAGTLKTFVKAEMPMAAANDAFRSWAGPKRVGKLVVRIDA